MAKPWGTDQVAISSDGTVMAIRNHNGDSWWVFKIPTSVPTDPYGFRSDLPDDWDWTRLFQASEDDLLAEELDRIGSELESAASSLEHLRHHQSRKSQPLSSDDHRAMIDRLSVALTVMQAHELRANAAEAELDRAIHERDKALAQVERLRWLQIYRPDGQSGRCRKCSGRPDAHRMSCAHYVGPLTHEWRFLDINGTFTDQYSYECTCGRERNAEGMEALGPCPDADLNWRGPRSE